MRKAVYGAAILAGVLLASVAGGRDWSSASAAEAGTRIENAPCGWFTQSYPGAWGTDHKIIIDGDIVVASFSFSRGTYRLADGTDASEYLENKCGRD